MISVGTLIVAQIPAFQTWAAQQVATRISKALGTTVRIDKLKIRFFDRVHLEGFYVEDLHRDTLLYVEELDANFDDVYLDASHFDFDRVKLRNAKFNVRQFWNEDDLNIQFILDALKKPKDPLDTTKSSPPELFFWKTDFENLQFTYEYRDTLPDTGFGMNYDHIRIRGINGHIDNFLIVDDSLSGELRNMRAYEPCGIRVNDMDADFIVSYTTLELANLHIKTPRSEMEGKVRFDYSSYDDLAEFIDSVQLRGKVRKARVNLDELAVFSEELRGLDMDVDVSGNVVGTIDNLRCRNVVLETGAHTRVLGNFHFQGLPEVDSTYFSFQLNDLRTAAVDLRKIPEYPFYRAPLLGIPSLIDSLGIIGYRGKLIGTLDNVSAEGHWTTAAGEMLTDVNLRYDNALQDYRYEGFVSTTGFNLGKLVKGKPSVGMMVGDAVIQGESFKPDLLIAHAQGSFQELQLSGYRYRNLSFDGDVARNVYNGTLKVNDPNLQLQFQGYADFTKMNSRFDFSASIDQVNLTALKLIRRDSALIISTEVVSNFTGNNLDNLFGQIDLSNTLISYGSRKHRMEDLMLSASGNPYDRQIVLLSDMADVSIDGAFRLATMPGAVATVLNSFLPSFSTISGIDQDDRFHQNFRFNAELKDISLLEELFFPDLRFPSVVSIHGKFDSALSLIDVSASAPKIDAWGVQLSHVSSHANAINNQLALQLQTPEIQLTDSVSIEHIALNASAVTDSMAISLDWASKPKLSAADAQLNAMALFNNDSISLKALPSIILVGDTLWQVNEENLIRFHNGELEFDNLAFLHAGEFVRVDGWISDDPKKELDIIVDNFRLRNLNPFIVDEGFTMDGVTRGIISLSDLTRQTLFKSNLDFKGIQINNEAIGDGALISKWDPNDKKVLLDGFLGSRDARKLSFEGAFIPNKPDNNLDLDLQIRNLRLDLFKPYVSDLFSNVSGLLDGDLHLSGSPQKPVVEGEVNLDKRTFVTVDFLNTRYQVLDKVYFRKNLIYSKSLKIRDANQNVAQCALKITHTYFDDFLFDVKIDAQNIQALNTAENQSDLFFGTAYATGTFHAYGPIDNIIMDINARTERGTVFSLPLSSTSDVSQQDFIVFESAATRAKKPVKEKRKAESRGYEVHFNLEVTPEAEARLLFDPKVGDVISGNGSANLQLEVTEAGEFNMYGDYNIEKGEYLFTLQNIINKKFLVQKGGTISFRGDPYDADINLAAVYRLRTALYPLVKNIDSSAAVRRPIDVDATMFLTDKLMKPTVKFDVQLPNADDQTRNLLKSQIANEDDLNRQVFSLVLFRTFLPNLGGTTEGTGIANVGTNGFELISSQLSQMLSQFSKDVNIGVNYSQGDATSRDQVNVNLSTNLFNDRVTVDGTVGNTSNTNANTTNLVGEFNLEVKVTGDGAIRIKVFNRSNQYLLVTNDVPYTQGVGVFYRREFDELEELRRKKR